MDAPLNQTAEVLQGLINNLFIDRDTLKDVKNVTARIADLRIRHNLDVTCVKINTKNKHGRPITFGRWMLHNKIIALEIYTKINKKK